MANKYRGEVAIKLKKHEYILRPSFQAICAIESETNMSIIKTIENLQNKNLTIKHVVLIIFYGIKAYHNSDITQEEVGDLICNEGLINILPGVIKFLENAIGLEEEKNE